MAIRCLRKHAARLGWVGGITWHRLQEQHGSVELEVWQALAEFTKDWDLAAQPDEARWQPKNSTTFAERAEIAGQMGLR